MHPDGIIGNRIQRLRQEGAHQDGTGFRVRNATAAQVEHLLRVQFANGRAVAALHIVGEDFEFRLGIDLRVRRQQQRLVHLVAVGLLRIRAHLDLALKHAARPAGQHVFHGLA